MITWDSKTKEMIQYACAGLLLFFGMGMSALGFFVEPTGEVSSSVLVILGQTLAFGGAVFGINLHYSNELDKFKQGIN